jgi:N-acetylmuramoyl-L-alanine amidase
MPSFGKNKVRLKADRTGVLCRKVDVKSIRHASSVEPGFSRTFLIAGICLALTAALSAQGSNAAALYREAVKREATLRGEIDNRGDAAPATPLLERTRILVNAYEDIARLFPGSPYGDDALWHGALLASDAFWEFGQRDERARALTLFNALASRYPTSSLTKQSTSHVQRLDAAKPSADDLSATAGVLRAIRRESLAGAMRVTLEFAGETIFHEEELAAQPRVVIDLQNTRPVDNLKDLTQAFSNDVVRQIRVGSAAGVRTRVVLDLQARTPHTTYALYNPYRVVVDFARDLGSAKDTKGDVGTKDTEGVLGTKTAKVETTPARNGKAATSKATQQTSALNPRAAKGREGFSLSRQLGLGVGRVVIDPGHGGYDPGAMKDGVTEADVVLDVSMRLERLLLQQPGVEVVLTRRTNAFVPLEQRTALANRVGADLFLSIHANASEDDRARGIETYFLNFATNPAAEAIAARENATAAGTMRQLPDIVKAIALNNKIDESRDFATLVQSAIMERLKQGNRAAKDLGVKQAPFMVLIGATMPSILAEISFLTNPQEAALLRDIAYRQQVAEALFNGIMRYQQSLKAGDHTVSSQ